MKIIILKALVVAAYLGMLYMNYLANARPLNNRMTGEVSDQYPTLFTPAGLTFSIWGIIYAMLGIYVGITVLSPKSSFSQPYQTTVMILFILSSLLNVTWLVLWHYDYIFLSTVVMILLLLSLGIGVMIIPSSETLIKSSFSIYFAWICVALIANVTILLIKYQFNGFGIAPLYWLIAILVIGVIISFVVLLKTHDILFGLVLIWAYFGILIKHISMTGWDRQYPAAIIMLIISLVLMIGMTSYTFYVNSYHIYQVE
jgi:hypothetical protein